jgi:hypothetical protein
MRRAISKTEKYMFYERLFTILQPLLEAYNLQITVSFEDATHGMHAPYYVKGWVENYELVDYLPEGSFLELRTNKKFKDVRQIPLSELSDPLSIIYQVFYLLVNAIQDDNLQRLGRKRYIEDLFIFKKFFDELKEVDIITRFMRVLV